MIKARLLAVMFFVWGVFPCLGQGALDEKELEQNTFAAVSSILEVSKKTAELISLKPLANFNPPASEKEWLAKETSKLEAEAKAAAAKVDVSIATLQATVRLADKSGDPRGYPYLQAVERYARICSSSLSSWKDAQTVRSLLPKEDERAIKASEHLCKAAEKSAIEAMRSGFYVPQELQLPRKLLPPSPPPPR